jgi:hypothetical protein
MASLVQDVWLGWDPRLRARRLAPWEDPPVRLLFHLDAGVTLDEPWVAGFLEALGARLEVVAWEPRGNGGSAGRFGAEVLDDVRRLVAESGGLWGGSPGLVVGGFGLGAWLALAAADAGRVGGVLALSPSLAAAGPEHSALRQALDAALERPALAVPVLLAEGRERDPAEADRVAQRLLREPRACLVRVEGGDRALFVSPWAEALAIWTDAVGRTFRS